MSLCTPTLLAKISPPERKFENAFSSGPYAAKTFAMFNSYTNFTV